MTDSINQVKNLVEFITNRLHDIKKSQASKTKYILKLNNPYFNEKWVIKEIRGEIKIIRNK